jgi:transaldolase
MLDQYDFKTSIIAAGLEHPGHLAEAARMGADAASMPLSLLRRLAEHPLTETTRREQLELWRRAQN